MSEEELKYLASFYRWLLENRPYMLLEESKWFQESKDGGPLERGDRMENLREKTQLAREAEKEVRRMFFGNLTQKLKPEHQGAGMILLQDEDFIYLRRKETILATFMVVGTTIESVWAEADRWLSQEPAK